MAYKSNDKQYEKIVKNILNNKEFKKMKLIEHHGVNRFDHSLKVSYYSYKVAKALHLNYIETARGGLLHDFFFSPESQNNKDRFLSTFIHPSKSLETASNHFSLSIKEKDMIRSHMFPLNPSVPKYMESWIVSIVDKFVAINELSLKCRFQLRYAYNLMLLVIIGFIK